MIKALYYIRLFAGPLFLSLAIIPFLYSPQEISRLPASAKDNCSDIAQAHFRDHTQGNKEIADYAPRGEALSKSIPSFEQKYAQVESKIFTPKTFLAEYLRDNGKLPTLRTVLDFFIEGHQQLVDEVDILKNGSSEVDYFIRQTKKAMRMTDKQRQKIEAFAETHSARLDKAVPIENQELMEEIDLLWVNPFGDWGELTFALRFQGVDVQNLVLGPRQSDGIGPQTKLHADKFGEKIGYAFGKIKEVSEERLAEIKRQYPHIFREDREDSLDAVQNWMQNKEVDLVVKGKRKGQYILVEVKNYNKVMTKANLYGPAKRRKKGILAQQLEMKEIIEFLGFKDIYTPAIIFLKGIDKEAKEHLEENGIMVILPEELS